MNDQATSTSNRKPCGWCCRGGATLRPGFFSDFDTETGYGVGVCGGCGGLGYCVDDPEFRSSADRIKMLRFAYYPASEKEIGPGGSFPPSVAYTRLLALKTAIVERHAKYGPQTDEERAKDEGFARGVVSGDLDDEIARLRSAMDQDATRFRLMARRYPDHAQSIEAMALSAEGRLDEAEALLKRLADERPEDSTPHHGFGAFYVVYRRDPEKALPHFLESTKRLPAKMFHFAETIGVLLHLDRRPEAVEIATRAKQCPDFDRASDEEKRLIDELIKAS